MAWLIGAAVVLGGVLLYGMIKNPGEFSYRGRRYRRQADGGFTYADGTTIADSKERAEVEAHWNNSQSSSDSDAGDGGGDGGGGGD